MKRKILAGIVSSAAVVAFAVVPVASQAAGTPHWYSDGKLIVNEKVSVRTSGVISFHVPQFSDVITCKVKDTETIENPAAGGPGLDEMTSFRLSGCKAGAGETTPCTTKMEIIALGLPWKTHLEESLGIRDWIEGIELEFRCKKGAVLGTITGPLNPKVGASVLEFEGGKTLVGPFGPVTVTGVDKLIGPAGDKKITAA